MLRYQTQPAGGPEPLHHASPCPLPESVAAAVAVCSSSASENLMKKVSQDSWAPEAVVEAGAVDEHWMACLPHPIHWATHHATRQVVTKWPCAQLHAKSVAQVMRDTPLCHGSRSSRIPRMRAAT